MDLYRRYGQTVMISKGKDRPVMIYNFAPELNEVLFGNPDLFHWSIPRPVHAPEPIRVLGSSFITMDGDEYRQRLQLTRNSLHSRFIESWRDKMVRHTGKMLDGWKAGEQRDMHHEMHWLAHTIDVSALFSIEDPEPVAMLHDLSGTLRRTGTRRSMLTLPLKRRGGPYAGMLDSSEKLVAFLRKIIAEKRAGRPQELDMLDMLISSTTENGAKLSDDDIIAEAYTFMNPETTASALTWTLLLLAQHPDVHGCVVDELDSVLRGEAPALEQFGRLKLLENVIKESLRLFPPFSFRRRRSAQACQFGPFQIPSRVEIISSQYVTHRLPEIYRDPQRFDPDRWETLKPTQFEYFPFGSITHHCLGKHYVNLELTIVLAMLLQRYRLTVAPGARVDRRVSIGLEPANGLPMTIARQDRRFTRQAIRGNINEMVDFA
jgi:cytochrome P450